MVIVQCREMLEINASLTFRYVMWPTIFKGAYLVFLKVFEKSATIHRTRLLTIDSVNFITFTSEQIRSKSVLPKNFICYYYVFIKLFKTGFFWKVHYKFMVCTNFLHLPLILFLVVI